METILTLNLTEARVRELFGDGFLDEHPLAAAEPSTSKPIRLADGTPLVVMFGTTTGNVSIDALRGVAAWPIIKAFLRQYAIAPDEVLWIRGTNAKELLEWIRGPV